MDVFFEWFGVVFWKGMMVEFVVGVVFKVNIGVLWVVRVNVIVVNFFVVVFVVGLGDMVLGVCVYFDDFYR